jgi:hypothetical protein
MSGAARGLSLSMILFLPIVAAQSVQAQSQEEQRISQTLDNLHDAASKADFDRYFDLYASDAIFLGTDATERWTREEFMAYAKPYFDQGRGWTYVKIERHIYIADNDATAWFDERLDNASLGETRGSGVLVKADGEWQVAQYNLTIPIPNSLAGEVAARIRTQSDGE